MRYSFMFCYQVLRKDVKDTVLMYHLIMLTNGYYQKDVPVLGVGNTVKLCHCHKVNI